MCDLVVQVNLRLSEETLAAVDRARGDVPRQRWLVRAVERALGDAVPRAGGAPSGVSVRPGADEPTSGGAHKNEASLHAYSDGVEQSIAEQPVSTFDRLESRRPDPPAKVPAAPSAFRRGAPRRDVTPFQRGGS